MPQRADKMTGGPSGKKRGPGDLRHPAGAQHARLKRENTAELPKGVTGVVLGGKPGTHTVGGKKKVLITQKQMDALHAAKRSAEADRKKTYKEPAWLRADEVKKRENVPGFMKEIERTGKEREGEPSARGGMSRTPLTREMTKDEKAARLTRLMRKGYRKGYRVPKRPERKSSGRSSGR